MKHTPEPWYVAHHQFFYAAGHLLVGQTACPPALSDDPVATQAINADRIVACVNACAGISEESLADDCWNKMRDDRNRLAALNAEFLSELSEYRAIRDRLAAQDKAGTLPDDYSIYIGLLENRLSEQRNLNSAMEQQRDELLAAAEIFRDSVLHQRHSMADNGMTNDQVNDVLGLFDDTLGEAIAKAGDKL